VKISLCMITKDEERFLPHCLDSIKGIVDEIIVVDTGSSDRTCDIALAFGAKIYHHPWQNDFSLARNFGLDRAKGDWILILDADEVLEGGGFIRQLVEKAEEDVQGFLFQILNYSDEAKSQVEKSVNIRLLRNKPENRFSGAIHEQLPLKEKCVAMTDLVIHHDGYILSVTATRNKSKRNLEILQQEVIKEPENPFVHFNLGTEYIGVKEYEQAVTHFFQALKLLQEETGYASRMYKLMTLCFLQMDPRDDFKTIIDEGIKKYSDYPDLYYMRGLYCAKIGELPQAIVDLIRCLIMDQRPFPDHKVYVTEDGVTNYKAFYELGRIFERMEKREEALTAYARSLQSKPLHLGVMEKLKRQFGEKEELLSFLEQRVLGEHKNELDRLAYAHYFLEQGDITLAFSLLENLNNKMYSDDVNFLYGIGYFQLHHFDQATAFLTKIPKSHALYPQYVPYLAVSLWLSGVIERAKHVLMESESPGSAFLKAIELLLLNRNNKIQEGIRKFPFSEQLKKVFSHVPTS
jgi:glycosyltransferase involved in cell wall biosynthesis